jgi:hypothetical protein
MNAPVMWYKQDAFHIVASPTIRNTGVCVVYGVVQELRVLPAVFPPGTPALVQVQVAAFIRGPAGYQAVAAAAVALVLVVVVAVVLLASRKVAHRQALGCNRARGFHSLLLDRAKGRAKGKAKAKASRRDRGIGARPRTVGLGRQGTRLQGEEEEVRG